MAMRLTAKDKRVLDYIAQNKGASIPVTASVMDIPERTMYDIFTKLLGMKYIRKLPVKGMKTPALYVVGTRYIKETAVCTVVGANCTHPLHGVYSAPDTIPGVVASKECPDGFVAAHLNGSMSFTIEKVGTFDDPKIDGVGYVGSWGPENDKINGCIQRSGTVDIDGQEVTFYYRKGIKTGNESFSFSPARIFVDPDQYQNKEQASIVFYHRAMKLSSILAQSGWRLINPVLDGDSDFEVAIPGSEYCHFIEANQHDPTADIFVDGSPGKPEAEMRKITSWEKVQDFAKTPTKIAEIRADTQLAHARLDELMGIIDHMISVQEKTNQAAMNNAEIIAQLVKSDAELSAYILQMQTRQTQSYVPTDPEGRFRRLEGYQ